MGSGGAALRGWAVTIKKGRAWGEPGALPAGGVVVRSDAEARRVVTEARRDGGPVPPLGLLGGDLCRTMGGRGDEDRLHGPAGVRAPVDLGSVLVDGRLHWFVAHLVARRSWWRGPVFAAMNAQWLGPWNVAPRGHPNDGRLDTFEVTLGLSERLAARRRLPSGTHLPHPGIVERHTAARQLELDPPLDLWLDGENLGRASRLSIRVEPDALLCCV